MYGTSPRGFKLMYLLYEQNHFYLTYIYSQPDHQLETTPTVHYDDVHLLVPAYLWFVKKQHNKNKLGKDIII